MTEWATYYDEIPDALTNNDEIREHAVELISDEPIIAKSLEGGSRTEDFREIIAAFIGGDIDQDTAEQRVWNDLPPQESPHSGNNRLFHQQWAERLIRSQASRFYNQAVMEILVDCGIEECYVPYSPRQDPDSDCTQRLTRGTHSVPQLLETLYEQQREGNWDVGVTIPGHANCTHTVVPPDLGEEAQSR